MKAFHAYDIRGIYDEEFDKHDVYKIGFFIPKLLNTNKILVGRDARISSPEVMKYLSKGITDAGADVYDCGLATTPMVYYGTAKYEFEASVMITASHNSKEYNGLKVSRKMAEPVGFDTGLNELKRMTEQETITPEVNSGRIIHFNIKDAYIEFLMHYKPDLSELTIAVDCSNGMAGLLIKEFLGDKPNYIYDDLDGTFPNHEANPLVQKNVADLKKLVLDKKCDLGVIFDGDGDRVMFVDELGQFISPDLMIAVMGHYFLEKEKGIVLQDIRSSKAVGEYLCKFGGEMSTWRVGRAYASPKLKEINGIYGGELAGHYYFRDFYYSDSGIMACMIILNVVNRMKKAGKTVSKLISEITSYYNSGELNFKIEKKKQAMDALKNHFSKEEFPSAFHDFDGYRLEFKEWWFNVRPSNTEPYLRFLAEATTQEMLERKIAKVKEIFSVFE